MFDRELTTPCNHLQKSWQYKILANNNKEEKKILPSQHLPPQS